MIRWAKKADIPAIKKLVDSFEEMDVDSETFPISYYERILKKGILIVAEEKGIIGVCFGTYSKKESWADLLGLVVVPEFRKKGIGSNLVKEFELFVRKNKLKSIDLYADPQQISLFKNLKYIQGRTYTAFRKKF